MNPLTLAVSKVIILANGNGSASATGFFYKRGEDIFFITNKHVVKSGVNFNDLTINPNYWVRDGHCKAGTKITIRANDLQRITYLHTDNQVDIAVLWIIGINGFVNKLTDLTNDLQVSSILCINSIKQTEISAEVADNAFIIGYPHGHNAELGRHLETPIPIWKCGTIATEMSLNYDANNSGSFLIDATGQQGNSGSPVIAYGGVGNGMFKTANGGIVMQAGGGLVYRLLGVMSAILINPTTHERSDLCLVWKKELIDEIINSIN